MTQTPAAPAAPSEPAGPAAPAATAPTSTPPPQADDLVVSQHEITVGGEPLRYTVTAGRVVLRAERGGADEFEGH